MVGVFIIFTTWELSDTTNQVSPPTNTPQKQLSFTSTLLNSLEGRSRACFGIPVILDEHAWGQAPDIGPVWLMQDMVGNEIG